MQPSFASYDPANGLPVDSIPLGNRLDCGAVFLRGNGQDLTNCAVIQLAKWMTLTRRAIGSTSLASLAMVFSTGARCEMPWVAARRIVAGVQQQLIGCDGATGQDKGNPMGTTFRELTLALYEESSIAINVSIGKPWPAIVIRTNLHFWPKEEGAWSAIFKC